MSGALARTAAAHTSTGGGNGNPKKPSANPAEVIPFPVVRRLAFLERTADCVASCRNPANYLAKLANQQRTAMRRRGLSEEAIESEVASFEREIMWRLGVSHGQEKMRRTIHHATKKLA
jgi:Family of unknown function (DUF6074)